MLAVTTIEPVHGPLLLNGEPAGAEPDDPLALSKDGAALRPGAIGGCIDGCADGNAEGVADGNWECIRFGEIEVGIEVGVVVGKLDGVCKGSSVEKTVGTDVGFLDGSIVGKLDGICEGSSVGKTVGTDVGFLDGRTVVGPGVARLAAVAASVETAVTM